MNHVMSHETVVTTIWNSNLAYFTYLACCFVCLDSKESVACIWWPKDVTKSSGVWHVLGNEGYLVNWMMIQAVLQCDAVVTFWFLVTVCVYMQFLVHTGHGHALCFMWTWSRSRALCRSQTDSKPLLSVFKYRLKITDGKSLHHTQHKKIWVFCLLVLHWYSLHVYPSLLWLEERMNTGSTPT
jgi:hypothetical protein